MANAAPKNAREPQPHLSIQGFRKYDRIRQYLSLVYLYGCFNAKELAAVNNRSVQDFHVVIHALWELIWPEEAEVTNKQYKNKKCFPHVSRSYTRSAQNRMADSYMMFPFDKEKLLVLYLRVLQRLRESNANAAQLDEALANLPAAGDAYYLKTSYHVHGMADFGGIHQSSTTFSVQDNLLRGLDDGQLWELYHYVCFAASVTYPRVPGSFLRRAIERELLRRGKRIPEESPFVLRHNSNHNVFDEEVVFRLLHIIEKKQVILINGYEYLPVKLRVDCRLGRWYVLMANEYKGKMEASIWAVFRMGLPTPSGDGDGPRWEQAKQVVEEAYPCGQSLFSYKSQQKQEAVCVEAKLHFGTERGRRNQFRRELRIGAIEQRQDGEYYRALINNPLELLPLLRAYAPWLEVLPGNHDLDVRMREGLQQMLANLDGAPWSAPGETGPVFEKLVSDALGEEKDSQKDKGAESEQVSQERKLLTPFQSRLMQFCLDLLAYASGNTEKMECWEKQIQEKKESTSKEQRAAAEREAAAAEREEAAEREAVLSWLAKRYGIASTHDIIALLRSAEFLAPGDKLRLPKGNRIFPELPLSMVEQEYLWYILDPQYMPEVTLFLSESTQKKLTETANKTDSPDQQAKTIEWAKHIEWAKAPGMELPNNPGPEGFRLLIQAIQNRCLIRYRYRVKQKPGEKTGEKTGECLPWKLEYSAYDRRWWVILYDPEAGKTKKAPLNHIRNIQILEEPHNITQEHILAAMDHLRSADTVDLRIRNKHNALQRCYTAFENHQIKQSSYSPEEGFKLSFYTYEFDKEEILRQLMYLGPNVSLDGPASLQEELRKRLRNALAHYAEQET